MTTKADQQAAERVLKAAVKRAVSDLGRIAEWERRNDATCSRRPVVAMLTAAGTSAALLLGEDPS